jgi:NitT/TauT family transport system substrate-binding protein
MVANAGVNMVTIWGMENPDWLISSTDPAIKKCADVKGQAVGVDSINGARSVALREMIAPCNLKTSDVQEVALSSNVGSAMVAGQIKVGVLHIDDVPIIEEQIKKKLTMVVLLKEVNPLNHYLVLVALRDNLAKNRDAYVRLVAAHIDGVRYIRDSKNLDQVAKSASPTGRSPTVAKSALAEYFKMEFWPVEKDGLARKNIEAVIDIQKRTGGIKDAAKAPAYERLADTGVWQDAMKLVQAKGGK